MYIKQKGTPIKLVKQVIKIQASSDDIILDFFSGSVVTIHVVMQFDTEDSGKPWLLPVQLLDAHRPNAKISAKLKMSRLICYPSA